MDAQIYGIFILAPSTNMDCKESLPRMENGPHELEDLDDLYDMDDDPNEGRSDMDEWFPEDGSNDQDRV
jgi:hypothetical protein